MAANPLVTPPAVLHKRQDVNSVCAYFTENNELASVTCDLGIVCLQQLSHTPGIAYCSNQAPVTGCIESRDQSTTNCNSQQTCCSEGQECGTMNINSGALFHYECASSAFSIDALNPTFVGYDKLPASATAGLTTSTATSSSSSNDNGDLAIGISVVVGGIVFVALAAWLFWWRCCKRRRDSWWNRRKAKYKPIADPAQTAYSGPFGVPSQNSFPADPTPANAGYALGPVTPPAAALYDAPPNYETTATAVPVGSAAEVTNQASNIEWQQSSPPKIITYRVEYIPGDFTKEKVKSRLFSLTDRPRVTVRSLAPSTTGDNKQTATIDWETWTKNSSGPSLSSDARALNISIDRDFHGWTPLNDGGGFPIADLVAVTGLAGHAYGSWATEGQHMWLRDYLPSEFPNLRVITYGYPSQLTETKSSQDLDQHAEDFAEGLAALWGTNNYSRPTIFVGHSLGCLIIKQALISSEGWKGRPDDLERIVPLLIFLGGPHNGLATDALRTLVKGTPSASLIEELQPGSPLLGRVRKRFARIAQNVRILSVYERQPTKTVIEKNGKWVREGTPVTMVEKENAVTYLPLEKSISSNTDHRDLSRLKHTEGSTYGAVKRAITVALGSLTSEQTGWRGSWGA